MFGLSGREVRSRTYWDSKIKGVPEVSKIVSPLSVRWTAKENGFSVKLNDSDELAAETVSLPGRPTTDSGT